MVGEAMIAVGPGVEMPEVKEPEEYKVVHVSTEPEMTWTMESKVAMLNRVLPEWKQVLKESGGYKPRKFAEAVEVITTPATFNPSAQGDFAYTCAYIWDGRRLEKGPGYAHDGMLVSGINPYERTVDVPKGIRVWITTYDGQWGGYWSRAHVYVHPSDLIISPGLKLLHEGKMHEET